MTRKPGPTIARLRLVAKDGAPVGEGPGPRARRTRRWRKLPRLDEPFTRVRLAWLNSPKWRVLSGPEQRLYIYLLYASSEGQCEIQLDNVETADLGMSKWQKNYHLRRLAQHGLVTVKREGMARCVILIHQP